MKDDNRFHEWIEAQNSERKAEGLKRLKKMIEKEKKKVQEALQKTDQER